MEQNRLYLYQTLFEDNVTDLTYVEFKKKYMSTESQFVTLYNDLVSRKDPEGTVYYNQTIEKFFQKYACDLFRYSNYCIQEGFPKCASVKGTADAEAFGFGKKFIKYRTTLSRDWLGDKPEIKLYSSSDGETGEFVVASGPKINTRGTYKCNGIQLVLNEPEGITTTPTTTTPTTTTPTTTTPTTTTPTTTPAPVKAVVIQRGDYNLKVAGSDAIIY